jgi:hypothetical protein
LSEFERVERCVDDTVHFDSELEEHWWRTIDLLTTVGNAGIVLNKVKFQFAQRAVDFAGFRILDDSIEPLPKYLDAIHQFPTPLSITDIRSWFGLVNQVGNYAQLRDIMSPFKAFLSPSRPFHWTPELNAAFVASKASIVAAIREGVEIFDIAKPTCLRLDWSSRGIGYFLLQQHCHCSVGLPDCCPNGWKVTLAGSRFLAAAEQRYAAIEGEALAIAWGLEQTRYFTLGCAQLLVVTDHKPLVKIFGDRTLDEITNTRLFRLKQRTLPWRFRIEHMPGRSNSAADATSRHPVSPCEVDVHTANRADHLEYALAAAICRETEEISAISWSRIADAMRADDEMRALLRTVEDGFPDADRKLPHAAAFWQYRNALHVLDGVIIYEDRAVIPPSLRQLVLKNLHAAHQGTSSMELRARAIVFWPGITSDIHRMRAECDVCHRNAPSQAALPSVPADSPSTPFEAVVADFFEFGGRHYLVVGDRLSGWVEIFSATSGTSQAGAAGLIGNLRSLFATFGVPEELSSDGGPEFTASATRTFLSRWGVRHRVSSAYNPQSNGRAEVAVKSAKRLLRSNVGPGGTLDNDRLLRAMLQLRNTPDPDCNISPAQILFGRPIRDTLSFVNRLDKFSNPEVRPTWRSAWSAKEAALRTRFVKTSETLNRHARPLAGLTVGQRCFVQNQAGNSPKKWDRTGTVMEVLDHDRYCVKVDGSGRLTTRNRRFLRAYVPVSTEFPAPQTAFPVASSQIRQAAAQYEVPPSSQSLTPSSSARLLAPSPVSRVEVPPSPPVVVPPLPMAVQPMPLPHVEVLPSPVAAQPVSPLLPRPPSPMLVAPPMPMPGPHRTDADAPLSPANAPPARQLRPRRNVRRPRTFEPETGRWRE